jgi:hypothetical protein
MYLKDFIDRDMDDPMRQPIWKYRQVRNDIEKRVL